MRALPALILLLLAVPLGSAQMDFAQEHQVRIAYGDIATTSLVEAPGKWNFHETVALEINATINLTVPAGHELSGIGCTGCRTSTDGSDAPTYHVTCIESDTDQCGVTFGHSAPGEQTLFSGQVDWTADSIVILYTSTGTFVHAAVDSGTSLNCTLPSAMCKIDTFSGDGTSAFWFTVSPAAPATTAATPASGFGVPELLMGLIIGAGAWYILVRGGFVQKRQRKQVAGAVAHKEVAKQEDKATLEGRKRVLMAALKELELAKMNKQLDTAAYDILKADFKKQTVTVMRALEE